jgi:hypothetical protein
VACRGVHFALTDEDLKLVLSCDSDDALVDLIQCEIEERYLEAKDWSYETDKAWDAIHRCLAAGYLIPDDGPYPASFAVLGGKELHAGSTYIVSLVLPAQVAATSEYLAQVTEQFLRSRYFDLDEEDYGLPLTEEDFSYTAEYFSGLPGFFRRAADAGRAVIFTVDQ